MWVFISYWTNSLWFLSVRFPFSILHVSNTHSLWGFSCWVSISYPRVWLSCAKRWLVDLRTPKAWQSVERMYSVRSWRHTDIQRACDRHGHVYKMKKDYLVIISSLNIYFLFLTPYTVFHKKVNAIKSLVLTDQAGRTSWLRQWFND